MATKTVVSVVDDIDGSENAETVSFAYGGATYEIDLATGNREALAAALAPFIAAARSSQGSRVRRSGPRFEDDAAAIRRWASENGLHVSHRGRIPRDVREQYENR
jgi:hypothetical protein